MQTKKYIGSYDGIRVIALLGVVFYHLFPSIFKSGYLGVVTFFVMAGYLTIYQAIGIKKEDARTKLVIKKIKDKFIKLYPPLFCMIFLVSLFVFCFLRADLGGISGDIKTSLLSIYNYVQIFEGASYFEDVGRLAPFTHLWALSLEIQVYILIFIFFYGNYKSSDKKNWFSIFFFLAALSYGLSIYLIHSGAELTRVYYGTETRLYSFLLGGMAALVSGKNKQILPKALSEFLIFVFLCVSIGSFFIFDANEFVFNWIFPLYSLLIAVLMVMLRHSDGYQTKILSSLPFRQLSKRSYHIYLWHFPIIAVQEKLMAHSTISNGSFYLIFFASCLILSEASYRLITKLRKLHFRQNRVIAIALVLFLIVFNIPYKAISDSSQERQKLEEMKATILENEKIQKERMEKERIEKKRQEELTEKEKQENIEANKEIKSYDTQETEFPQSYYNALEAIEWVNNLGDESLYLDPDLYTKYRRIKGVLIGDSLASMSYHTLYTYIPDFTFDTDHSRHMGEALEAYTPYLNQDNGDYIILSLGSNGDVLHEDIDKIRNAAKDKTIILNTIVLPYRDQEEERNASIKSYETLYDNVYLSDWYGATKHRPELFFDDKIHTGERGARIMSQLIMKKIIEIETSN